MEIFTSLRQEGVRGQKNTSLAYIKVQPVMELKLFTESQNLHLWQKYGASLFGVMLSPLQNKGKRK